MTSRVQKGGPIFKPLGKARARATSTAPRQAATPIEGSSSAPPTGHEPTPSTASMPPPSMPPPATLPVRGFDADVSYVEEPTQPVASSSRAPPIIVASKPRVPAPPIVSQSSTNVVSQPRNPAPPIIVSRPAAVPIIQPSLTNPPAPSPTLVNPSPDDFMNNFQLPPQDDFNFPDELSQLIPPTATLVSTPDVVPTPESGVKKKLRKRKKKDMAETDGDATEGETSEKPKKARKKRAKSDAAETDGDATEGGGDSEKPKKARKKRAKKDAAETDGDATEGEGLEKPKKARKKRAKKDTGGTSDGVEKPKRKRKAKAETVDGEESTVTRKKRKKSSQLPFDADADPGEEIDPTVITMAELCVDNGQGRISSKAIEIQKNHLAWKQQSKEKRARMKALAEQKKYGRPDEDGEGEGTESVAAPAAAVAAVPEDAEIIVGPAGDAEPAMADATGSGFDYTQDLTRSRFTVQVRIGPNGETIIDEESLTVDRTEDVDTTNYVHVVESDQTKFVNSASYTKKCRGSRWSAEETDLFYEALSQHGENYELISLMLPGRSRTACKNKFKTEDKKDTARINRCLEHRIPIDMQTLTRITGRDFSGPVPIIKAPTPPPVPEPSAEDRSEPGTPHKVRKRSRSRALSSMEGVEIIGDADSYDG
ncbi:hypothetical protein C8R47DRAFT_1007395 [Mycena vitilis]|nr:hypothetical protein C8R47DRAFT_1007395 [Mycena vitilis]